ncbi:MAG: hypothetical protein LC685_02365 [Actinobacteria bacterium]|nr:hypothetical protein [Actinomycetota bacterium]
MTSDDALWGTNFDPTRLRTMVTIRRLGAGTLRVPFLWSRLEPRPGRYDISLYDGLMTQAARMGLDVLPVLFDPPAHRSSRPPAGGGRGTYPPASNRDFALLAMGLVRRYGPYGLFWRQHPAIPQRPIRAWQIWNEPNLRQYWPAGPDPAAYADMLRTVGPAIRAVDPGAEVVTAGLNDSEAGIPLARFLQGMYRAGARGSFTTLGIHPYARSSTGAVDQIRRAREVMRRNGDPAAVRVTEIGWATGGPSARRRVSEKGQASLTSQTMTRLLRLRRRFHVNGVCVFNWRDTAPAPGARDTWGLHTGLLAENGRPKPVAFALASLLHRVVEP